MRPASRPRILVCAAAASLATGAVLAVTHHLPSFSSLGPRLALPAWLATATLLTATLPLLPSLATGARRPADWGLSWGHLRRDARVIVVGVGLSLALAWAVSRSPEVRAYYPRYAPVRAAPWLWLPSTLLFGLYGLAWETMFRGHLLLAPLAARRPEGPGLVSPPPLPIGWSFALVALQTALFATGHLDKPPLERWLSIPAGLFFGLLALRTRSVLPGFLLHFTVSTGVNLFSAYG